ncbi:MAG: zinc-ribbon domain-containing protein [Spirochaetes bacterium]|nr:zinc-ribbon domain-containing protein [Spirochaetota bacterium]
MIISCTNCGTKYSAADSKVVDKKFAFTCPSCQTENIIDNRKNKDEEISLKKQTAPVRKAIKDEVPPKKQPETRKTDLDLSLSDDNGLNLAEEKLPTEDVLLDDEMLDDMNFEMEKPSAEDLEMDLDSIEPFEEAAGAEDIDSVEIDLDRIASGKAAAGKKDALSLDEDSGTFDSLNLDFDEENEEPVPVAAGRAGKKAADEDSESAEEELNLNIDDLDISELTSAEDFPGGDDELNLALSPEEGEMDQLDEKITLDDVKSDEIFSQESDEAPSDDTDITIDLDSLDIQLEEIEGEAAIKSGEDVDSEVFDLSEFDESLTVEDKKKPAKAMKIEEAHEDEDITLDLDSLDLNLDETGETMEGETFEEEEDERLTLADAGLTPDEFDVEKTIKSTEDFADEELHINIDEVTSGVSGVLKDDSEEIISFEEEEVKAPAEIDELPEIDLDEFEKDGFLTEEEAEIEPVEDFEAVPVSRAKTNAWIPGTEPRIREIEGIKEDISDTVPAGIVSFSIDYSLKFSRIGALLRLTGIFAIGLIPHILVNILYSIAAYILGFINNILIILTGESVDDYTEIQENSLRQALAFGACYMGIVEEMPVYSGRRDVDYSLQFDVTYPLKRSRILAFLRLSVIGIFIITLPHMLLLFVLSVGSIPICLAGLISVLIKKTWPNILFDSMVKYWSYSSAVMSYVSGLVDKYPKFKLE